MHITISSILPSQYAIFAQTKEDHTREHAKPDGTQQVMLHTLEPECRGDILRNLTSGMRALAASLACPLCSPEPEPVTIRQCTADESHRETQGNRVRRSIMCPELVIPIARHRTTRFSNHMRQTDIASLSSLSHAYA